MEDSFWQEALLAILKKEGVKEVSDDHLAVLSAVYEKHGGTWQGMLNGKMSDVSLLKKICNIYAKKHLK